MSRWYNQEWAPYVTVAQRRETARHTVALLRKQGHAIAPVSIDGRAIAKTFWGKAWCANLESYRDFENRLPRGRSYVRNGAVLDLRIAALKIEAMVSGSSIYRVAITIAAVPPARWRSISRDCAGGIDSIVELLQGRLSKGVMERICRQDGGLFPAPSEIRFACSCPDGAAMCKHVAAALYGVGARLDESPELLFRLRGVDERDLVTGLDAALPLSDRAVDRGRVLEADDVSALFGLDMEPPEDPAPADQAAPVDGGTPGRTGPKPARARKAPPKPKASTKATASKHDYELTPDGFVKWWK